MKDLICSVFFPGRCGWCVDKDTTRWDRLMRFDQPLGTSTRPWWERTAIWWATFNTEYLNIWRLGRRWHFRFHVSKEIHDRYFGET